MPVKVAVKLFLDLRMGGLSGERSATNEICWRGFVGRNLMLYDYSTPIVLHTTIVLHNYVCSYGCYSTYFTTIFLRL